MILLYFLFPLVICELPYDLPVIQVNNPQFDDAFYGEDYNFLPMTAMEKNLRFPDKQTQISHETTLVYALHFPLPSFGGPLTESELEALKKEFPKVTGDWDHFNRRKDPLFPFPINGSAWDITRIFGIRRVVIRGELLEENEQTRRAYETGIDYFDEYSAFRNCLDKHEDDKHVERFDYRDSHMMFDDQVHVIDGKIHYIRFNIVCDFPGSHYCDLYEEAVDDRQGTPVEALSDIELRVSRETFGTVVVRKWRLFDLCVTEDRLMPNHYPELRSRLHHLGFTDEILKKVTTREQKLALRLFSHPRLRDWRQFRQDYSDEEQDLLEHMERQLWKQKYLQNSPDDQLFRV